MRLITKVNPFRSLEWTSAGLIKTVEKNEFHAIQLLKKEDNFSQTTKVQALTLK